MNYSRITPDVSTLPLIRKTIILSTLWVIQSHITKYNHCIISIADPLGSLNNSCFWRSIGQIALFYTLRVLCIVLLCTLIINILPFLPKILSWLSKYMQQLWCDIQTSAIKHYKRAWHVNAKVLSTLCMLRWILEFPGHTKHILSPRMSSVWLLYSPNHLKHIFP